MIVVRGAMLFFIYSLVLSPLEGGIPLPMFEPSPRVQTCLSWLITPAHLLAYSTIRLPDRAFYELCNDTLWSLAMLHGQEGRLLFHQPDRRIV